MGVTGRIIDAFLQDGFRILAMRLVCMSRNDAEKFYAVHRGREFFSRLVDFMTSGPCVVMLLEREDAVAELRRLVGNTDPAERRRVRCAGCTAKMSRAMRCMPPTAWRMPVWRPPFFPRRGYRRGPIRAEGGVSAAGPTEERPAGGDRTSCPLPAGFCFPTDTVRLSALFCNLFYPCRDVGEHFGREGLLYLPVFRRQARSGVLEEVD